MVTIQIFVIPYMTTKKNYIDIDKLCDAKIYKKKKKKLSSDY
jgi:hypothetical protein